MKLSKLIIVDVDYGRCSRLPRHQEGTGSSVMLGRDWSVVGPIVVVCKCCKEVSLAL